MEKIINAVKQLWSFLNGKKLLIGGSMVALSQFLGGLETTWAFHTPFLDGAVQWLANNGQAVLDFGLAHKVVKSLETEAPKQ